MRTLKSLHRRVVPLDAEDTPFLQVIQPAEQAPRCGQLPMVRYLNGCATTAEANACIQLGHQGTSEDWANVQRGLAACERRSCQREAGAAQPITFYRGERADLPSDPVVEELVGVAVDDLVDYANTREDHVN
jgi:hypothetical protein